MKKLRKEHSLILIMTIYLAGIFMGAIDTGIVTPARTIIQNDLGVDAQLGIWMITIYTLFYAASIPIMGKTADRYGRKYIFLISIFLFGMGSLFTGLSQYTGSFTMLLISRAVQAIGGGGIIPVATAEFGTTFPKEKRGVALGLVGGVYGIANIFGASAGSFILDIFGQSNWSYIFFINLPITLFIIVAGLIVLPNHKQEKVKKIDFSGILVLTIMILSLLYGLKHINFLNFWDSFTNVKVYAFLIISILIFPLFLLVEKKAEDPVINLSYFSNRAIVVTLILSFISGIILMGVIFVPQFAENNIKIPSGSGGYFVIVLGIFAGIGAPLSGRLIDKFGVKPILGFGFSVSALAALFLIFVMIPYPSLFTVIFSLVLMGLGMGFSLGTPLNYMMLENTKKSESNSALATLSLIRSLGTTIAPSIMIAFIASAGMQSSSNVAEVLPENLLIPSIVYSEEISTKFAELQEDSRFAEMIGDFSFPDFSGETLIPLTQPSTSSEGTFDEETLELVKSSDVTTISVNTRTLYVEIFDQFIPIIITNIENGVQSGIDGLDEAIPGMETGLFAINMTVASLEIIETELSTLPVSSFDGTELADLLEPETLSGLTSWTLDLMDGFTSLSELQELIINYNEQKVELEVAIQDIQILKTQMVEFKEDVSVKFNLGVSNYLNDIDNNSIEIEDAFQATLNGGFGNIYITTMSAAIVGLLVLQLYINKPPSDNKLIE